MQTWIRVITAGQKGDIIYQYVSFAKVLDDQIKIHGRTIQAVAETIRICKDNDVLKEYLTQHEQEVQDIMITLFENETIMDSFTKAMIDEGLAKGEAKGRAEGRAEGQTDEKRSSAKRMIRKGYADKEISEINELPLSEVAAIRASMPN